MEAPNELLVVEASGDVDGVRRLRLRGEIDLGTARLIDQALAEVLAAEPDRVVVDLAEVTFIDSSGLNALVRARNLVGEQRGTLVLAQVPPELRRLLEISGLLDGFTVEP